MDHVDVATAEVADVGRELARVAHAMSEDLAEVGAMVDGVAHTWRGDAAAVFQTAWVDVRSGAERVTAALAESARQLEVAANGYAQQDDSSARPLLALS